MLTMRPFTTCVPPCTQRTGAYYQAVMSNKRQFRDKVVLDVGTGSGILAIFAAKAGAKKVYAVEATSIATSARKLIEHNKVITSPCASSAIADRIRVSHQSWMDRR